MDTSKRDKLEVEEGQNCISMNYNLANLSPNQEFSERNLTKLPIDLVRDDNQIPVCPSSSCFTEQIAGSIEQSFWNHHPRMILEKQRFSGMDASNSMSWSGPSLVSSEVPFLPNHGGILPHCFPQLPADIGLVQRAFRSSCCFTGGNAEMRMKNPFSGSEPRLNECSIGGRIAKGGSPVVKLTESAVDLTVNDVEIDDLRRSREETKVGSSKNPEEAVFDRVIGQEEPSSLEDMSEEFSSKSLSPKRRKRNPKDAEAGESKETPEGNEAGKNAFKNKQKANRDPNLNAMQTAEKNQGPQACDPSKGEYIHVRARRGQATNSHSLAERLRREKISERMKLLQDLVPGCNKVTGKAVMLDEIINYVQSLQRQVEFLSMKLATVNPRLDFNTGGPKEILQPAPSSSSPFPRDFPMVFPDPSRQSQPPCMSHSHPAFIVSDVLQRSINPAMPSPDGPTSRGLEQQQLQGVWESELHNVVHMNYGTADDAQ